MTDSAVEKLLKKGIIMGNDKDEIITAFERAKDVAFDLSALTTEQADLHK